jgi:adenosylcobinamide-GDP ribazoletransferase
MKSINLKNLHSELISFNSAVTFLTTIKLPLNNFSPDGSVKYFPVVGLIIGIILYFLGTINHLLTPLLQLIFLIVTTGALHLDGLADTSDAIFSHRSLDEKLKIMKDSHIGTMGVISIFIILSAKLSTFSHINNNILLIFVPFYSRFVMITAIYFLPYLRQNSINKEFFVNKNIIMFLPSFFIITATFFMGIRFYYIFAIALLFSFFYIALFKKIFNGLTGDTLGFICETSETIFLLSLTLF